MKPNVCLKILNIFLFFDISTTLCLGCVLGDAFIESTFHRQFKAHSLNDIVLRMGGFKGRDAITVESLMLAKFAL